MNGGLIVAYGFLILILYYLHINVQEDESKVTDLRMSIILASQPHLLALVANTRSGKCTLPGALK